ncbi:hypothetical protein [Patulibacter minatonensis]|uniref:hypothetical protein n=1 Tax=Patulibacter minatonensis TaxID=298163 RepID=UPI0004B54962|nr:hypothetical protein [Patulibacter minatonensis]
MSTHPRSRPRRSSALVAVLGALALGAAGCGSDDATTTTDDSAARTTTATTTAASPTTATTAATATTTAVAPTTTTAATSASTTTPAAAGGLPEGDPAAEKIDPCSLLTDADVVGAGGKAGVHRPDENDVGKGCDHGVLTIYVGELHPNFTAFGGEKVPGVGDEAYYRKQWHDLRTRVGGVRVDVQCRLCSGSELPTLKKLAGRAVSRLP